MNNNTQHLHDHNPSQGYVAKQTSPAAVNPLFCGRVLYSQSQKR